MKAKIITYAILFVFNSSVLFSQNSQTFQLIKLNSNNYFDSIHNYIPDSLFYAEGSEYSEYKRWENFWEQRLSPDATVSQYFEKLESSYIQQRSTTIYNTDWTEIGPLDKPANPSSATGIGPIEFIKIFKGSSSTDPRNQNMICGSTAGGLFFTNDIDNTGWINAGTDKLPFSTASCAVFKVDDPEVVYLGVGAWADCEPGKIEQSGGIFRANKNGTINQNTVWDRIADYNSFGGHTDCRIQKILTDPYNPDILYVATPWGLFKSSNINETNPLSVTWVNIMKDASQQPLADNVYDVEMHPGIGNNNILYASFSRYAKFPNNPSLNTNLIKYTTDGGSTWHVFDYLPAFLNTELQFVTLEVSDAFPDNIYIRYMKSWPDGTCCTGNAELYRYVNLLPTPNSTCTLIHSTTQGIFGSGNAFGVSQNGTDEIIFLPNYVGYTILKPGISTQNFGSSNTIHDDKEGFTFYPFNSNEVWMATHGGIDKSIDGGLSWQSKSKGLGVAHLRSLATSYQDPDDITLALFHDACVVTNGNNNDGSHYSWEKAGGGDGLRVLIDKNETQYKYYSNQSYWNIASNNSGTPVFNFIGLPQNDFNPKGILNRVETKIIYEVLNGEIIRSLNRGASPYPAISAIKTLNSCTTCGVQNIYSADENANYLFASFSNNVGKLYYTDKAADPNISITADWHDIVNLPNGNGVQYVKFDPEHQNTIFIAFYPDWASYPNVKLLYRVENFTSSQPVFTELTSNLPDMPATVLELEKGSDGGLYYACDAGIYYTNNKLLSTDPYNAWIQYGNKLPHCPINGMEINYKNNKIRVGLYGRGAWEADLYCPQTGPLALSGNEVQNKFEEADGLITSIQTFNQDLNITYRATDEVKLLPGFLATATTNSNFTAYVHPCSTPGNSFRKLNVNNNDNSTQEYISSEKALPHNNISIIPNPNNGTFQILITKNNQAIGVTDVKVYDMIGKVIWENNTPSGNLFNIDISGYAPGIYYVRAINEAGDMDLRKLIKQ